MHRARGFTLIEMIMYAGIFAFILGTAVITTFQMIEARQRAIALSELADESHFIMRKIEWAFSGLESLVSPAPGATSTVLTLNKAGFAANPITIRQRDRDIVISYGSGRSDDNDDGAEAIPLNDEHTAFTTVRFEGLTGDNPGVRVTLGVEYRPASVMPIYRASTTVEMIIYARKQ